MPKLGAQLANFLLELYGTTGFHRGKGDLVRGLSRFAQPVWGMPKVVHRLGINYQLDRKELVAREIYFRTYEPNETRLMIKIVQPGWVCLDVGANIGYYSLLLAKLGAAVHAFEPSPQNLIRLRRNISLNPSFNIAVHESAISDFCGSAPFTMTSDNAGASYLGKA